MKERPLNFDFNDGEKVEVTDEQKKKLEKSANELKQHIGMLLYLIKGDSLNEGTRDATADTQGNAESWVTPNRALRYWRNKRTETCLFLHLFTH